MTDLVLSEEYMNTCSVDELAEHIGKGLVPSTLTFAAEILGRRDVEKKYTSLLLNLLEHPSAVVREGAIYGISAQGMQGAALGALRAIATDDPDPGVRDAAKEAVEDLIVSTLMHSLQR